jgi:hypothetical protein
VLFTLQARLESGLKMGGSKGGFGEWSEKEVEGEKNKK